MARPALLLRSLVSLSLGLVLTARAAQAQALRDPQVQFPSAGVQTRLDEQGSGRDALTDQLDRQRFEARGMVRPVVGVFEPPDTEFGVYAIDSTGMTWRVPLFQPTPPHDSGERLLDVFDSIGKLQITYFDANGTYLGRVERPWPVGIRSFGLYTFGPRGTWYSEDSRNAGVPHLLVYEGPPGRVPEVFLFAETGSGTPDAPGTFTGVAGYLTNYFCEPYPNSCGPVAAKSGAWGRLKRLYR